MTDEGNACKACGQPLMQVGSGHRQRQYCDERCRQEAFHRRREQAEREHHEAELRERFGGYLPETLHLLDTIMQKRSVELAQQVAWAINAEAGTQVHTACVAATRKVWLLQKHVARLEQELATYREIVDLSDRARMERQLLDIGSQIGYRQFIPLDHQLAVGHGEEYWRVFAESADDKELAQAIVQARYYAENLIAIDAQAEVQRLRSRIRDLEKQLLPSR